MAEKTKQRAVRLPWGAAVGRGQWRNPRKIVATEQRGKCGILRKRRSVQSCIRRCRRGAIARIVEPRVGDEDRNAIRVQARRVQCGTNDSESIVLREEGLLVRHARFYIVDALKVRCKGAGAGIGERPILSERFLLKIRRAEVGARGAPWGR